MNPNPNTAEGSFWILESQNQEGALALAARPRFGLSRLMEHHAYSSI
jgi:hypothetical protein